MSRSPAPRSPVCRPPPTPSGAHRARATGPRPTTWVSILTLPRTAVPGRGASPESPGGQRGEPGPGRPAHPEHRYLHVGLVLETCPQARPGLDAYMCLSSEAGSCFRTEQAGKLRHGATRSLPTTTQLCALRVRPPDQAWPADVSLKPNPRVGNSARGGLDVQVGFSRGPPQTPPGQSGPALHPGTWSCRGSPDSGR